MPNLSTQKSTAEKNDRGCGEWNGTGNHVDADVGELEEDKES